MSNRKIKDPNDVLDYQFGFTEFLGEDSISSHEIIADPGITVGEHTEGGGVVTVWLSGGEVGRQYTVTCRVTTAGGRIADLSLTLLIRQQ